MQTFRKAKHLAVEKIIPQLETSDSECDLTMPA